MGYLRTTERTKFFAELPPNKQEEYLSIKTKKFMHTLDNIYLSIFIKGDGLEDTQTKLMPFLEHIRTKKEKAKELSQPVPFLYGYQVMPYGFPKMYDVVLSEPDLYDTGIRSSLNLTNIKTNRIHLQLRAFGLWTCSIDAMLNDSIEKLQKLLADYGLEISRIQENRLDYCYHTNIVSSVDYIFHEKGYLKHLKSKLSKNISYGKLGEDAEGTINIRNGYEFGSRKSNVWFVRVYDKVKEIIEVSKKNFFFKMWHDEGLISYYDKWCMEYAFPIGNDEYLHKAKIAFYVEHGTNSTLVDKCKEILSNKNTSLEDFKKMALDFMPEITPVVNIEYQTMREFYSPSDKFIQIFQTLKRDYNPLLKRIYQILDNRELFLNYLHGDGFSFCDGTNDDGSTKYLWWWERLRNTKIDGIKSDETVLREYSYNMDQYLIARQLMSKNASFAVYNDRLNTEYNEDNEFSETFITDNYKLMLEEQYKLIKYQKERQVKNRKKKLTQQTIPLQSADDELNNQHFNQQNKPVIDITDCIVGEILPDDDNTQSIPTEWQ